MIEARFEEGRMTVTGHAGYGVYGADIVCAAASMAAFGLWEALKQVPGSHVRARTGAGHMELTVRPETHAKDASRTLLQGARAAFSMLAREYPEYVRIAGAKAPDSDSGDRPPNGQKGERA